MLEKLAFYHLTGKELQQVTIRNAKEPGTENPFIKFLLTDNGKPGRKIKDWRRCMLEAALELKPPNEMVEGCPTALNFDAFQGDARKRRELLSASFQRDLPWNC